MKKLLKYIAITLFIIVVVLAGAVMLLVNFINPNDYRNKISALASEALHKTVTIHGDIRWQFLPAFGVVVHGIAINDQNNAAPLTVTLDSAHVGVQLWPLLHQRFEVDRLDLDGLQIEKTMEAPSALVNMDASASLAPAAALADTNLTGLSRIHLRQLRLHHATIVLHDPLTHIDSQITDVTLNANNLSLDASTPFELSFRYLADTQKNQPIHVQWQGTLINDSQSARLTAQDCHLTLQNTLPSQKTLTLTANLQAVYEWHNHRLTVSSVEGNVDDLSYSAHLTASNLDQTPDVQFAFDGQTAHLRDLLTKLGLDINTRKADVLQKAHLKTAGTIHNQQLNLSPLQLDLDDSHMDGDLQAALISNSSLNTNVHVDHIDVGAYLKPSSTEDLQFTNIKATLKYLLTQDSNGPTLNGPIRFDRANIDGLSIEQFSTLLDMKDQEIQLSASKAQLLSGQYQGNSQINFDANGVKWSTTIAFSHIQIQPLLALFSPNAPISGLGDFNGSFNSQGTDAKSTTQHLNGHAKIAVHNGVLHGINLNQWINKAKALKTNDAAPPASTDSTSNSTPFGDLTADATIQNGVAHNDNLLLQAPFARAKGHGTIDLNQQQLDYHLTIDQISALSGNHRLTLVPLIISGAFAEPHIQIDLALLSQQLLGASLEKQQNRLADTIAKNTGNPQLGKLIQHMRINRLLGGA